MIPGIGEYTRVNGVLNDGFPSYATLHQAEATFVDMGERTITTQIRIDGDISPNFDGWELTFKGERFILPVKEPQAVKDNTTRNSLIDLTFRSWVVEELKRYFYFQPASINASTAIADQYQASVKMSLANFARNFNTVLQYYWPLSSGSHPAQIEMILSPSAETDTNLYLMEIDHIKIWDVLTKFYEIFHQRWSMTVTSDGIYQIRVGYDPEEIEETDHLFQYGYEGGLLRFERQVQDEDITNILLGRGGEKNLPYRYFKLVDPQNDSFKADPDAIPELANIYFDRLHDINFRWYVRGWMQNPNRDKSWDSTHTFPTYTEAQCPEDYLFAFRKGKTDEKFNPVEYVKDDESIAKYGEHWGALDDNDDIFPTIQGRTVSPFGRIDESVAFSEITTDDIQEASEAAAIEQNLAPLTISSRFFRTQEEKEASGWKTGKSLLAGNILISDAFTIPSGKVGLVSYKWLTKNVPSWLSSLVYIDTEHATLKAKTATDTYVDLLTVNSLGEESPLPISPGTYRLELTFDITLDDSGFTPSQDATIANNGVTGTFGIEGVVVNIVDSTEGGWAPTFDIWVKNIWNTQKAEGETDQDYAERVWLPILGDHLGNEAKMVFTSGMLSTSSDYEFTIVSLPVFDDTRTINGVPSHWRITLQKSDAEWKALGVYIPSTKCYPVAGDTFYFIGIDMPNYYTILAEQELNTYKASELSPLSDIAPTWVIGLDKVRVHTEEESDLYGKIADRLNAGMLIHLSDPRFLPDGLALYMQSISYKWQEPTNEEPYIVPDIEVVLSDKVVSQSGTVAKLQGQVNSIQSEYVRADQVEETVRRVASAIYLKKTGESDSSASPTTFSSKVTSDNFRQGGVGGSGWGIYKSNAPAIAEANVAAQDESVLEFDRIIVRKELQVQTLVVNQIAAQGGREIMSAAKMEVTKVIGYDNGDDYYYDVYFDQKQGSIDNLFVVGDIALCQRFNSEWGTTPTKYYRMIVMASEADHITLNATGADGDGEPEVGDVIVQYGHISDTSRQYVIIRDVVGGGYQQMLSGLTATYEEATDEWHFTNGTEYYFAGKENNDAHPRWFVGDRASRQYIEYANGHLTIMGPATVGGVSGSTEIAGNFVQTGEISLGQVSDNTLTIYSGISGIYNASARGGGVAAWYGGPKVDHEVDASAITYARSLFRFDGSGYLASGNITWNADGTGRIPGVSWNRSGGQNVVTIDGNVKLESLTGDSVTDLINAVRSLSGMFILEGSGTTADPYRIRAKYNFYSVGYVTAYGIGQSQGGSSGGSTTLAGLNDVTLNAPTAGQVLKYNGSRWVNSEESAGGVQSNWSETDRTSLAYILNKPTLATVATSGSYADLSNKPTIPSAPGTLNTNLSSAQTVSSSESLSGSIRLHKVSKTGSYTDLLNKPTKLSEFENDGFVTLNTAQTISGQKTFSANVLPSSISQTLGDASHYWGGIHFKANGSINVGTTEVARLQSGLILSKALLPYTAGADYLGTTDRPWLSLSLYRYIYLVRDNNGTYESATLFGKDGTQVYIGSYALAAWGLPTGIYSGGNINFYVKAAGESSATHVMQIQSDKIVARKNLVPLSSNAQDLGASAYVWNNLYAKRWYPIANNTSVYAGYNGSFSGFTFNATVTPSGDLQSSLGRYSTRWERVFAAAWYPTTANPSSTTPRIEYDSNEAAFKVVGNLYATGWITALKVGSSSGNAVPVSSNLVPTQQGINLGSDSVPFSTIYVGNLGTSAKKIASAYITTANIDSANVTNLTATGIVTLNDAIALDDLKSHLSATSWALSTALSTILNNAISRIMNGSIKAITCSEDTIYRMNITEAIYDEEGYYEIYFGKHRKLSNASGRWYYYNSWN